jgi:subtilisin family serine protease
MRQGSLIAIALAALLWTAAPAAASNDPLNGLQWGMSMIEADAAHSTSEGQGATVAVIDTGADFSQPDLAGRLTPGHDFVNNDDAPDDDENHGTHVTGIVAADANNGIGVEGVAPQTTVLVVKVLDDTGAGSIEQVAAGIDYARTHGADVINLSLGPNAPVDDNDPTLDGAIQRAVDAGIVVVAAAGNGLAGMGAPLPFCEQPSASRILCVGAVDRNDNHAFYSNFGLGLGISAPGGAAVGPVEDDVLSTVRRGHGSVSGDYEYEAGTSQATPHVSGVAALLVSLGVRGQAAVQRILATARDVGMPGPDPVYGAGVVGARSAVAGLSRGGAGGSGPSVGSSTQTGSAARVSVPRVQRIRAVLRRGLVVRCLSSGAGRCSARANARRRRIAQGSRAIAVGRLVTLRARPTRRGRAMLRAALRRHRRVGSVVRVALPGVATQVRRVSLRP